QDIVGRSHAGSRRVGGVIGLGEGESHWLAGAREQLQSNDPAQLRQYLTRSLRERRFDAAVRKAIETGKAIPATTIERAVTRYGERLLRHRAEMLGQVAAREAIGAGRQESINQLVEQGILRASNVRKRWQTVGDEKVRSTHRAMNEQERGLNAPFTSPSGAQMMYPGDQSLGAPLDEIANCRCHLEYEL